MIGWLEATATILPVLGIITRMGETKITKYLHYNLSILQYYIVAAYLTAHSHYID